jgi:hypothetical protein
MFLETFVGGAMTRKLIILQGPANQIRIDRAVWCMLHGAGLEAPVFSPTTVSWLLHER